KHSANFSTQCTQAASEDFNTPALLPSKLRLSQNCIRRTLCEGILSTNLSISAPPDRNAVRIDKNQVWCVPKVRLTSVSIFQLGFFGPGGTKCLFYRTRIRKRVDKLQRSEISGIEVHCAPSELKNTLM